MCPVHRLFCFDGETFDVWSRNLFLMSFPFFCLRDVMHMMIVHIMHACHAHHDMTYANRAQHDRDACICGVIHHVREDKIGWLVLRQNFAGL